MEKLLNGMEEKPLNPPASGTGGARDSLPKKASRSLDDLVVDVDKVRKIVREELGGWIEDTDRCIRTNEGDIENHDDRITGNDEDIEALTKRIEEVSESVSTPKVIFADQIKGDPIASKRIDTLTATVEELRERVEKLYTIPGIIASIGEAKIDKESIASMDGIKTLVATQDFKMGDIITIGHNAVLLPEDPKP